MTRDLSTLSRALAADQVVTDPAGLLTYEVDAGMERGAPDGVVLPHNVDDVVKIVRWASENGVPLVPRGAGTGLSGGAVAETGGVIVTFARMKRVLDFDEVGRSVVVQPGIANLALDDLAKTKGLYFPPDPASQRVSTIGGNIGENAGGPHCFKYGVTTNYITGVQVVLADGRVARFGGRALDYPEYDFVGLVNGGEGTLGIVTEASARLIRNAPAVKTMMAVFDSVEEAGVAVSAVIARGLVPATLEMMDTKIIRIVEEYAHAGLPTDAGAALIVEADGYAESVTSQIEEIAEILRAHKGRDLRIAQTAAERDRIWLARKSAAGAMARLAPAYYLVDGTVPRSQLAGVLAQINQVCDAADLRVGYVFHAGDGNLHPLILIPNPDDADLVKRAHAAGHRLMELCVALDGSITGEHGVGTEKREYMPLMFSPEELQAMQDVKGVFDPKNLLNPGKNLPLEISQPSLPAPGKPPASPYAPTTAQEAADAIRAWSETGQRIHIRGGGTKSQNLAKVSEPSQGLGALLSTRALCGIRKYALEDLYVTVGAGATLAELQAELARDKMWVPLVSPWSESTLGGIVATNFNAPLRMRYGAVRDLMLAATVALPNGRVIRAGRPVVKNVAGLDLPKLFIGSFGTLGVITDVSLKLAPLPRARATLIAPVDDMPRGLAAGTQLLRVCLVASALLLCRGCELPGVSSPYALVYTAEGMPEDVAAEIAQVRDVLQAGGVASDALSGSEMWAKWLGMASRTETIVRVGVATKDLASVLSDVTPALGNASFAADLANGLLYARGVKDVAVVRQRARAVGGYAIVLGSASQVDAWGHTPDGLDLMRTLKARWDPRGALNPGAFLV
jgi:D-lactate dehydrogenase (cytochrome)